MSPEILTPEIISILMFAGLLVGVFLGFPVAFVMISIALVIGFTGAGPAFLSMMMFRIHAIVVVYCVPWDGPGIILNVNNVDDQESLKLSTISWVLQKF